MISHLIEQFMEQAAQEESPRYAGDRTLVYTGKVKMIGYVGCSLVLAALIITGLLVSPTVRLPVMSGIGGLLLLLLASTLETGFTRITYEERGIRTRSPWRFARFIPFSAIRSCHYSAFARGYKIRTQGYGTIRISIYMRGIPDLLRLLPCLHPGYPPADSMLGNAGGMQTVPATAPPPKRTVALVFTALFVVLALGAFAWWALYPMPDRSQFTELEGQVTEISTQSVGQRDRLLKIRMSDVPALLTWSTTRARGASLNDFLHEVHRGDQISVLVAKSDLASPPKAVAPEEAQIRFVSLRTAPKEYLSFESHLLWQKENEQACMLAGISFLFVATTTFFAGPKKAKSP